MPWTPDYLDADEASVFVRSPGVGLTDLAVWCTAASRAVDAKTNRQFGQVDAPAARTYRRPAVYSRTLCLWLVEVDDIQDTTGMIVNGAALADSGAVLLPDDAPEMGMPYERLGFETCPDMPLTASALWGWTAFPAGVVGAVKLQVSRWAARQDSPFGVAGSPQDGSQLRLLARLDPDVPLLLAGLSRHRRPG